MKSVPKPIAPILSHVGVVLNMGLAGISVTSFGGIVFGGIIKIGGPLGGGVTFDIGGNMGVSGGGGRSVAWGASITGA